MSGTGGARNRGESRFYNPPALRRQLQQQQQQQRQQQLQLQRNGVEKAVNSKNAVVRRTDPDDCATSPSSSKENVGNDANSTNLDRFLQFTTPVVPAQNHSKTSMRRWRDREQESQPQPYFVLGDLWEFFKEWSAYGAQVPLVLNGVDFVMQYYCPYLSGMQLYIDPSRTSPRLRRPGEESDTESFRETSSDDSSDFGTERRANNVVQGTWTEHADSNVQRSNGQFVSSSSDEGEICNPPGQLIFEYLEHDLPFIREPLADKIAILASQFPELRTYRSCDLTPSSWFSVAWYPIYRIPTGPTLQNLDASFLTFHSLSTPTKNFCIGADTKEDGLPIHVTVKESKGDDPFLKLPLPTFGLASYKFKPSFWNLDGVHECQKAGSLLQAADNWLRLLQVNHPDYSFFVSSSWR